MPWVYCAGQDRLQLYHWTPWYRAFFSTFACGAHAAGSRVLDMTARPEPNRRCEACIQELRRALDTNARDVR
jgi:hypothetical protein